MSEPTEPRRTRTQLAAAVTSSPASPPKPASDISGLTLFEEHRAPRAVVDKGRTVPVAIGTLNRELICPICLEVLRDTKVVKHCLHRFCSECIERCLRLGNSECPTCRTPLSSRRELRNDENLDKLVATLHPDLDEYEEKQQCEIEEINRVHNMNNAFTQACNRGLKLTSQQGGHTRGQGYHYVRGGGGGSGQWVPRAGRGARGRGRRGRGGRGASAPAVVRSPSPPPSSPAPAWGERAPAADDDESSSIDDSHTSPTQEAQRAQARARARLRLQALEDEAAARATQQLEEEERLRQEEVAAHARDVARAHARRARREALKTAAAAATAAAAGEGEVGGRGGGGDATASGASGEAGGKDGEATGAAAAAGASANSDGGSGGSSGKGGGGGRSGGQTTGAADAAGAAGAGMHELEFVLRRHPMEAAVQRLHDECIVTAKLLTVAQLKRYLGRKLRVPRAQQHRGAGVEGSKWRAGWHTLLEISCPLGTEVGLSGANGGAGAGAGAGAGEREGAGGSGDARPRAVQLADSVTLGDVLNFAAGAGNMTMEQLQDPKTKLGSPCAALAGGKYDAVTPTQPRAERKRAEAKRGSEEGKGDSDGESAGGHGNPGPTEPCAPIAAMQQALSKVGDTAAEHFPGR
eukprot:g2455.t1